MSIHNKINESDRIQESIKIRGVCASLQSMSLPNISNVLDLFNRVGIALQLKSK